MTIGEEVQVPLFKRKLFVEKLKVKCKNVLLQDWYKNLHLEKQNIYNKIMSGCVRI